MAGSRQLQIAVWLVAVIGILNAEPALESTIGRSCSICGVWGCGAPVSSLIVWRGFVAAVLVPVSVVAARIRPLVAQRWGRTVLVTAIVLAIVYAVSDVAIWWSSAGAFARGFVFQRFLFSLVALVNAPVLPVVSAAATYWWLGCRSSDSSATTKPLINADSPSVDVEGLLPSNVNQVTE